MGMSGENGRGTGKGSVMIAPQRVEVRKGEGGGGE